MGILKFGFIIVKLKFNSLFMRFDYINTNRSRQIDKYKKPLRKIEAVFYNLTKLKIISFQLSISINSLTT